jgi:hypothetical protein
MVMGKPSVNRGKITSINSTPPTPKPAQQITIHSDARHAAPLSRSDFVRERFSDARKRSDQLQVQRKASEKPASVQSFSAACAEVSFAHSSAFGARLSGRFCTRRKTQPTHRNRTHTETKLRQFSRE